MKEVVFVDSKYYKYNLLIKLLELLIILFFKKSFLFYFLKSKEWVRLVFFINLFIFYIVIYIY